MGTPEHISLPAHAIGAAWLAKAFDVRPLGRFPVVSQIGHRRSSHIDDGFRLETFPEVMRPLPEFAQHLQFHLRHEILHLEFLSRLFKVTGPDQLQLWVLREPTGRYARRAAFLYEWLTGELLDVPENLGGNYINAIDDEKLLTASTDKVLKVARWRVNDNLPGTRFFCPSVVKTDALSAAAELDVRALFGELSAEFGEELLLRAAAWMTLRESKASFTIEGEADRSTRIQRFADVMARRTGKGPLPLKDASLAELQQEILGPTTTVVRTGLRQSPVFVGETVRYQEVVHYVAPPVRDLQDMLDGLQTFLDRTQGQSSVLRSAVAAFAFVYIHPMADGNGRIHRFLINDILRRDGVIPGPVILPVSAVITSDAGERRAYDEVLDKVSRPLMEAVRDHVEFAKVQTTYPDGVTSNLFFEAHDLARPIWRYPDLGPHVVYLSKVIARTLTEQMREESRYLRTHHRAREAIKEVVEMPDHQADRLLRSIEQNQGQLSSVLVKEMPVLTQPGVWDAVVGAVRAAFKNDGTTGDTVGRYPST
ncbi:Fic family protein [Rhodoferax sp. AJA081-3]|uniref:Fic family protein n=1 Tax=Rhodoferax sp. AJA081-3 TaxID=2752316 RepID=UPI001ADF6D3D|nr:Fic family protein [Rhodoferax sp. AJA081-3]QTN28802.1 Fic family protein [Rhodoferax sp. AJA081-3]